MGSSKSLVSVVLNVPAGRSELHCVC